MLLREEMITLKMTKEELNGTLKNIKEQIMEENLLALRRLSILTKIQWGMKGKNKDEFYKTLEENKNSNLGKNRMMTIEEVSLRKQILEEEILEMLLKFQDETGTKLGDIYLEKKIIERENKYMSILDKVELKVNVE